MVGKVTPFSFLKAAADFGIEGFKVLGIRVQGPGSRV